MISHDPAYAQQRVYVKYQGMKVVEDVGLRAFIDQGLKE
jgi:hypothetical protein